MDVRSELTRLENPPVALLEAEGVDVDFLEVKLFYNVILALLS